MDTETVYSRDLSTHRDRGSIALTRTRSTRSTECNIEERYPGTDHHPAIDQVMWCFPGSVPRIDWAVKRSRAMPDPCFLGKHRIR